MKKFSLLVILICCCLMGAFAQVNQFDRPFRFGLTASPSIAWLRPETRDYFSEGSRIGFTYGLIGDFRMADFYAVSTGINISYLGGKLSYQDIHSTFGVIDNERIYKLQYLEVPVTIKMNTPEIGYMTFFGKFGVSPGVNIRAKADDSFRANDVLTQQIDVDIKKEVAFLRAALIIGLGMEYSLGGRTSLVGGLTFNNGFTNTLKGRNEALNNVKPSANSNFIMLNVGVMF